MPANASRQPKGSAKRDSYSVPDVDSYLFLHFLTD
jgi:hypothetical protein